MRTKTGAKILKVLQAHNGADQAITATRICRLLGWPESRERTVRQIIADESPLWSHCIVCSVPGKGYFIAVDYAEVVEYDNWLNLLAANAGAKRDEFRDHVRRFGLHLPAAA